MKWHLMLVMVNEELPNLALLDTFIVRRLCAHWNMCHCIPPPRRRAAAAATVVLLQLLVFHDGHTRHSDGHRTSLSLLT